MFLHLSSRVEKTNAVAAVVAYYPVLYGLAAIWIGVGQLFTELTGTDLPKVNGRHLFLTTLSSQPLTRPAAIPVASVMGIDTPQNVLVNAPTFAAHSGRGKVFQ